MKPKVSILCLTYNHHRYIKKAIDSFLMQKTDFEYEILIHDDASTDNTQKVIKEYEKKYPKIIKSILRKKNLYSQGIRGLSFKYLLPKAKGKYVAICEGDDYWTDENKLQLQVDFLDKHPDHSICFHPVKVKYEDNKYPEEVFPSITGSKNFSLTRLLKHNFIQTNSVVYRKLNYKNITMENIMPGDWYLHIFHAKYGKIGFINRPMSVYYRHSKGIWSDSHLNPDRLFLKYGLMNLQMYFETLKLFMSNPKYQDIVRSNIITLLLNLIKIDMNYKKDLFRQASIKYPTEMQETFKKILNTTLVDQQEKITSLHLKNNQLVNSLNEIKTSKFYKLWQVYCSIKKNIKKI